MKNQNNSECFTVKRPSIHPPAKKPYYAIKTFFWGGKNINIGDKIKLCADDARDMLFRKAVAEVKPNAQNMATLKARAEAQPESVQLRNISIQVERARQMIFGSESKLSWANKHKNWSPARTDEEKRIAEKDFAELGTVIGKTRDALAALEKARRGALGQTFGRGAWGQTFKRHQ